MPTLKDRKRILNKDGTPAKVVQKLDQSPVFRQNGYNLKFDAVNEDYLDFNQDITLEVGKKLSIKFDFFRPVEATRFFFNSPFLDTNNKTQLGFTGDNGLFLRDSGNLGRSLLLGTFANGFNEIELIRNSATDYTINFNGQTTNTTFTSDFIFNNYFVKYFSGFDPTSKVYELIINDETFNFSESYGTTITGDNGTVATINTSAAQAENYTNTEIWQKNEFALGFDSVNQEFLSAKYDSLTITDTSDIDIQFSFYVDSFSGGRIRLLHLSESETSGGSKAFWFETNTNRSEVLFRQSNSDGSVSSNAINLGVPVLGVNTVLIKNSVAVCNGNTFDLSALNKLYTLNIQNPFFNFSRFLGTSNYSNSVLTSLYVQGEDFVLKNGLGTTITGSNGTIATINTSAAQAKDRINFGMHLKGNDVDGWIPYTKD